jgi:hypothetical protein
MRMRMTNQNRTHARGEIPNEMGPAAAAAGKDLLKCITFISLEASFCDPCPLLIVINHTIDTAGSACLSSQPGSSEASTRGYLRNSG